MDRYLHIHISFIYTNFVRWEEVVFKLRLLHVFSPPEPSARAHVRSPRIQKLREALPIQISPGPGTLSPINDWAVSRDRRITPDCRVEWVDNTTLNSLDAVKNDCCSGITAVLFLIIDSFQLMTEDLGSYELQNLGLHHVLDTSLFQHPVTVDNCLALYCCSLAEHH